MKYNYNDEVALARNYLSGADTKGRDKLIKNHYHQLAPALQKLKIHCERNHLKMYLGGYSDEDYMSELTLSLIKAVDMFIEKVSADASPDKNKYDASPDKNKYLSGVICRKLRSDTTAIVTGINRRQAETIDYCSENEKEITGCGAIPYESIEEEVETSLKNAELYATINRTFPCEKCNEKKRKVLYLRFFEDKTLEEIGKAIGKSAAGARQLEAAVLFRLRNPQNSRYLNGWQYEWRG
jgi:RNA polymerase sigma factor (sigma-70 family)